MLMAWDFNKIPKDSRKTLKRYFDARNFANVAALLRRYKVSPPGCASCGGYAQIHQWTAHIFKQYPNYVNGEDI